MDCDELYVSFLFPPYDDVSGITVFKRILNNKRPVDILQRSFNSSDDSFKDFNQYINDRISVDCDCELDSPECIFKMVDKSIELLKKDYKKIYSRSWMMQNHFIALEYKFLHPEVFWRAEFSDPLILNISNKVRKNKRLNIDNQPFIDNVNAEIVRLNDALDASFSLIENNSSIFYAAEYLTYLFADELIFSNENQRKIMINQFPEELQKFIMQKSVIEMHPTLDEEYYQLKTVDLNLDDDCINIAYFGRDYYGQRHFESLFYSMESLNHEFKDKLKIHIFIEDVGLIEKLISPLQSRNNFIVRKPLKYFDFLNASTQFDVLIVSDVTTRGVWPFNPYLPSKLSDYLGSKTDIWALCEKGSTLSSFDLKYKSNIADFNDCRSQLIRILEDNDFKDDDSSFDDEYFLQRLTDLNRLYELEFKRNSKLQKENRSLKKMNKEILSSNSWKLTRPLRRIKNNR